jgi:predicted Rossmann fold flavoprotein
LSTPSRFDVVVVGAGAAGLFCAGVAGQRGLKVLLVDHSEKVGEKIRISGGGRANFTNRDLDVRAPQRHFIGENPNFCRSALSRYAPQQFIDLVHKHGIAFHEKHKGQLFCDGSSQQIVDMLLAECDAGQVTRWQPCRLGNITYTPAGDDPAATGCYRIDSSKGPIETPRLVVATGGLSIPQIGASDFGYRLAAQFGLRVITPRPALVPLTFGGDAWAPYAELAGLALPVRIETGAKKEKTAFLEDLLFTHRGLSGPAVLQISSYWKPGAPLTLDFAPGVDVAEALGEAKRRSSKKRIGNELAALVPSRLADAWVGQDAALQRPVNEAADKALAQLAERVARWQIVPSGTEGYKKAEVTAGGVDTRDLSSQTMESKQPGLYFIGEVVDVTGWLGGYNFQWAWASAHACATAL